MASYIASNDNRFYVALESSYGDAAAVTEANRLPAVKLQLRQQVDTPKRIDKTGGRTFPGVPNGFRKRISFDLSTLMIGLGESETEPGYGPLFRAALGAAPLLFAGGSVQAVPGVGQLVFAAPHGLSVDQAVAHLGEIRFVAAIVDPQTVILNAPFTDQPAPGASLGKTITYVPASDLPSLSIFDYWDPGDAVHRIMAGGGVDRLQLRINGDFHQFNFSGVASGLVDNVSFSEGQAGLSTFPEEPAVADWNYSPVPGNLGQVWFGASPEQFFSVLEAEVVLDNDLDVRSREFGSDVPRSLVPGMRTVTADFRLYANTRAETMSLYQAARQRSPVSMMVQMGEQNGSLCGVYLKSIVPEVPEFEDEETRLQWRFRGCRAQGVSNDELVVAFG